MRKTTKKITLTKWEPIEVMWRDAFVDSQALNSKFFVDSYAGCTRKTLGYFMGYKDKQVLICETDDRLVPHDDGTDCERITSIPHEMCLEINRLMKVPE
jgi:hypothetical protein